MMDFN